jgi:sec-independent protein translocase protein TatA
MLSVPDIAIIGAVALLVFGPEQLPKVARKFGTIMRDVQNTSNTFIREMERAADESDPAHPDAVHPYSEHPYGEHSYGTEALAEGIHPDYEPTLPGLEGGSSPSSDPPPAPKAHPEPAEY